MRVDRVLDGELVQVELTANRVELVFGRLVEADPREAPRLAAALVHQLEVDLPRLSHTVLVEGHVDDHGQLKYGPSNETRPAAALG